VRPFSYIRPSTIGEAIALLDALPDEDTGRQVDRPRLLAGGTDLLTLMKQDIVTPLQLIDIKRLAELNASIVTSPEGTTIGALTSLAQLEDDPVIRNTHPALAEAAALAATPQLRNMATLGGNLLQRPRCWYYRSDHVTCWLKGGDECQARDGENQHHALFGGGPCYSTHPSDLATALVALGASVHLHGPDGERTLSLDAFFALPTDERRTENIMAPSEVITSITIPVTSAKTQSAYLKAMDRKVWAFAQVGVAAMLVIEDLRIAQASLVLGGVAPTPWRAIEAESLLTGAAPERELFERVAQVALEGAAPLSRNRYKIPLANAMIQRALMAASTPKDLNA
jgi:xanthine dehydrogenase YagS FAD-binding subunit